MPMQLILMCVLLGVFQGPSAPIVHRIFVVTQHNSSIIFEYANTVIPEGQPLSPGKAECLTDQLMATGLFSNAQINLRLISKGAEVDVDILPTWVKLKDQVVLREISMEGFDGTNNDRLIEGLRRRGLRANIGLLRYSLPAIRNMVLDSARELYPGDSRSMNDVEEKLSDLSFRIEPVAPQAARLRIIAGKKPLCE